MELLIQAGEVVVVGQVQMVQQAVQALSFSATPAQFNISLAAQYYLQAVILVTHFLLQEHWLQQRLPH
jgi:hypothetical protein